MKRFKYKLNGKKIDLTIKEAVTKYTCVADLSVNGNQIFKDCKAYVCFVPGLPNKAFLKFDSHMLCICDLDLENGENLPSTFPEKNREITSYLSEILQGNDIFSELFRFTVSHWQNYED